MYNLPYKKNGASKFLVFSLVALPKQIVRFIRSQGGFSCQRLVLHDLGRIVVPRTQGEDEAAKSDTAAISDRSTRNGASRTFKLTRS